MSLGLSSQRPSAPTLWFEHEGKVFALPLIHMQVDAELYVSTAIVRIKATWINTSSRTIDALFALPFHGAVASVAANIGQSRVLQTAMISKDEESQQNDQQQTPQQSPYEKFIPDLFRLPINRIHSKDEVHIEVHFIETLQYFNGQYQFSLQLAFAPGMILADAKLSDIVKINCIINAISKDTRVRKRLIVEFLIFHVV
jgi:Vault protein inter-alpha-trypsin domain